METLPYERAPWGLHPLSEQCGGSTPRRNTVGLHPRREHHEDLRGSTVGLGIGTFPGMFSQKSREGGAGQAIWAQGTEHIP